MTQIFGIGIGLFLIIAVWITAIILCVVSLRTHKDIQVLLFIKALIVTVILLSIPRESETPSPPVFKLYDHLFMVRPIILAILAASGVSGVSLFLFLHLMEPRRAQPQKQWKL